LFVESPVSNSLDPVSDTSPYVRFESISPYRVIPAPAGEGGTTFTAAFGGTTKVKLVVSTGNLSVAINPYIWNALVVTSARALLNNDEILANPTGTLNLTLPSAPRVGDRVRVLDYDYTWSATDKVIVLRNGMKINNVSDDLQLADAGNNVELVFNGVDNWVIV
jgi:hypothetical protein